MSQFYTKGIIKVKNADNVLVPFMPKTDTSCISDNNNVSLSQKITNMNQEITEAENSGGIEIMYEEPDSTNTAAFSNETLIGWIQLESETWSYTVNTTKLDATNTKTSIPFDLYNVNDASITVDWGDNTTSTFTNSDYSSSTALDNTSSTGLIHTYSEPGIYTVKVISNNFDKVKLYDDFSESTDTPIYYYKKTITEVNNAFPTLNVTSFGYCFYDCSSLTTIPTGLFDNNTDITSFHYCFDGCYKLTSIPTDLFKYNTAVTGFKYCFAGCHSLTTIPTDLFRYNTSVTDFTYCFFDCLSITNIPQDLFRYNTSVTGFKSCFISCTSLTSIPTDLFKYNTSVTDFSYCFRSCSSLISIPTDLFKYNTAVTTFSYCFSSCSTLSDFVLHIGSTKVTTVTSFVTKKTGVTRTVYVPTGSTTQTKFNSVASSLGLTVIGE